MVQSDNMTMWIYVSTTTSNCSNNSMRTITKKNKTRSLECQQYVSMLPDWCLIGFNQCQRLSKPSHIKTHGSGRPKWCKNGTRNGAKMEGQNDHAKTFRTWLVIFLLFLRHIDIWYDYVKVYGMTLDKDRVNRWWKTKHLSIFPCHLSNPKPDPFWRSIFLRWGSSSK